MHHRFQIYRTVRLALVAGLMTLASGLASAQTPRCTGLSGTYAFTFSGTSIAPGATIATPYGGAGVWTFDGTGKLTGTESVNFGTFVLRNAGFSGDYTVYPDCTGTATVRFPDGNIGHSDFVIADGGKTIYAVGVDVGALALFSPSPTPKCR